MSELPPETLGVIFDFAGVGDGKASVLLAVAGVCRYWQDTIQSCPQFWTTLCYDAPPSFSSTTGSSETIAKILSRWFGRAGSLPLKLELNCDFVASSKPTTLINYLARETRWDTLVFGTTSHRDYAHLPDTWLHQLFEAARVITTTQGRTQCWEQLRCLKIHQKDLRFREYMKLPLVHIAPNLEHLEINVRTIMNTYGLIDSFTNLHTLRKLHVVAYVPWKWETMFTFYFRTLHEGVKLESFKFHDHYGRDEAIPNTPSSLPIPAFPVFSTSITSLSLWDTPAIRFYLSKISLPSLNSLQLSQDTASFSSPDRTLELDIRQLVERSGCKLTTLSLAVGATSQSLSGQVIALLQFLTTLENLTLNFLHGELRGYAEFSAFLLEGLVSRADPSPSPSSQNLLPSLRSFVCVDHDISGPRFLSELIKSFRAFVEDPRRVCDSVTTTVATIDLEPNSHGDDDFWNYGDCRPVWTVTYPDKVCIPFNAERGYSLGNAKLFAGGFDKPLYARTLQ